VAALLEKARGKLDAAGEEDRTEIIELIEAIRDASDSDDAAALQTARKQLEDLLFYLEA
jgi:hypothetical protein